MYADTITLFNRRSGTDGDVWFPTILRGVDLNNDKAAIVAKYGEQSADNARLHIKFTESNGSTFVGEKRYYPPKEWANLEADEQKDSITFAGGSAFDFFILGVWDDSQPIDDDGWLDGFYNYMNARFDYVFSITSVAKYSVIPHFEIMAK